jgi:ubiquinone/menaquinone biosynthesis C-methylase UbiE
MEKPTNSPLDDLNKHCQSQTENSSSQDHLKKLRASHLIGKGINPHQLSDQQADTNESFSSYASREQHQQVKQYTLDSNNTRTLRQHRLTYQEMIMELTTEKTLKYGNDESKRLHKPIQKKIAGGPSGLDMPFAQKYLSMTEAIYSSESQKKTRAKLEPLAQFLPNPQTVVSVGIGSGEEVQVAAKLFSDAQVYGLDISRGAILSAREKFALSDNEWIEGSATNLPFKENSVDGIIMSAIMHEVYSYVPDGKQAWRQAIREVATKLAENGAFLLRDFEAPDVKGVITMHITSNVARQFYEFFREHYRVFASQRKEEATAFIEKRAPNDNDYPPVDKKTDVVPLLYVRAAEVILHFHNFFRDRIKLGNIDWKEINESYLPPHPSHNPAMAMSKQEYIETVLAEGNKALADTPYTFICVQDTSSERPQASKLLAEHFSLQLPESEMTSEQLVNGVNKKMELVFKKVRAPMNS